MATSFTFASFPITLHFSIPLFLPLLQPFIAIIYYRFAIVEYLLNSSKTQTNIRAFSLVRAIIIELKQISINRKSKHKLIAVNYNR